MTFCPNGNTFNFSLTSGVVTTISLAGINPQSGAIRIYNNNDDRARFAWGLTATDSDIQTSAGDSPEIFAVPAGVSDVSFFATLTDANLSVTIGQLV